MTQQERKTRQGSNEPEEQEKAAVLTTKQKPIPDETMFPSFEKQEETQSSSPALTINIHSWATPIVGVIMLVIGALAGFYARPTVLGQLPEIASETGPVVAIPTEDRSEQQRQLMASLTPMVRHFIGDSNAPVTIIEFGDFQ